VNGKPFQRQAGAPPRMIADVTGRVFTTGQPRMPRMITAVHTRTPRKDVADPAHLGMNRSFLDMEWFWRFAEIKMNRIITAILPRSLFGQGQDSVRRTLENGHDYRAADSLER